MKERISYLLGELGLSPSQFADIIDVQRSSISHIMSGRNKPSLDLVIKILNEFPDIDPDWLMRGTGEVYRSKQHSPVESAEIIDDREPDPEEKNDERILPPDQHSAPTSGSGNVKSKFSDIERIVIFYSDRTFREYKPEREKD